MSISTINQSIYRVIVNPNTISDTLFQYADTHDYSVAIAIARHSNSTSKVFEKMISSYSAEIHQGILDDTFLYYVIREIVNNPKTPDYIKLYCYYELY